MGKRKTTTDEDYIISNATMSKNEADYYTLFFMCADGYGISCGDYGHTTEDSPRTIKTRLRSALVEAVKKSGHPIKKGGKDNG
jgi:hypothetical protein